MSLTMIIGPMFSGKSKTLIKFIREKKRNCENVLVISHASDTRYAKNHIATHDKDYEPCLSVNHLLPLIRTSTHIHNVTSVFIEEAQFFSDLSIFVRLCLQEKKNVYVSGLQSDYAMRPFQNLICLIPTADIVMQLRSECMFPYCQEKASFSKCVNFASCLENNIGGAEKYMATCREHFYA